MAPGSLSMKSTLLTRSLGFFHSLISSPSHEVQVLANLASRDLRSNLGSNIGLIQLETDVNPWLLTKSHCKIILDARTVATVPGEEIWRAVYLEKLLTDRLVVHYGGQDDEEERLTTLINSLVMN